MLKCYLKVDVNKITLFVSSICSVLLLSATTYVIWKLIKLSVTTVYLLYSTYKLFLYKHCTKRDSVEVLSSNGYYTINMHETEECITPQ